jgi:hypothetical protein
LKRGPCSALSRLNAGFPAIYGYPCCMRICTVHLLYSPTVGTTSAVLNISRQYTHILLYGIYLLYDISPTVRTYPCSTRISLLYAHIPVVSTVSHVRTVGRYPAVRNYPYCAHIYLLYARNRTVRTCVHLKKFRMNDKSNPLKRILKINVFIRVKIQPGAPPAFTADHIS